jgi:hypothetical protein
LEWENTTPTKNQLKMLWRLLHTYEAALSTEFMFAKCARSFFRRMMHFMEQAHYKPGKCRIAFTASATLSSELDKKNSAMNEFAFKP